LARGRHSDKRRREADKARKREEKAERRRRNREDNPGGEIRIATVEEIQVAAMQAPIRVEGVERPPPRESSGPSCRLFVGGLSDDIGTEELRALFATHGEVVDASVATDRGTGESRGFGFVTMADRKVAAKVVGELDGQSHGGRILHVQVATQKRR
jgi:hypothetical protein